MKKWRCKVCGYVHEGDTPPDQCPICNVGPEEFVEIIDEKMSQKRRWKCTVCDYIHEGDTPPDVCPVCGVGPELFVLLEDNILELSEETIAMATEGTSVAALDKISYGLFIVSSHQGEKINAQCANSVFQLTNQPLQLAICLNKRNLTTELLESSGELAITILGQDQLAMISQFGHRSGREFDKFKDIDYIVTKAGCPILKNCVAYLEGNIIREKTVDVGTHKLFIVENIRGRVIAEREPLTYLYYQEKKRKNK